MMTLQSLDNKSNMLSQPIIIFFRDVEIPKFRQERNTPWCHGKYIVKDSAVQDPVTEKTLESY